MQEFVFNNIKIWYYATLKHYRLSFRMFWSLWENYFGFIFLKLQNIFRIFLLDRLECMLNFIRNFFFCFAVSVWLATPANSTCCIFSLLLRRFSATCFCFEAQVVILIPETAVSGRSLLTKYNQISVQKHNAKYITIRFR